MTGSGNWVLTSTTGFDPQSQGIPIVPSGVQVGGYTTVGRGRSGGIQVGCGGTKSTGYGCGQNNELHGAGSIGQALHGTKQPNDCAQAPPPPPPPAPSPTPVPNPPTGGCSALTVGGGVGCSALKTITQPVQSQVLCTTVTTN